jgi:peptide/nickel transport system permease protein
MIPVLLGVLTIVFTISYFTPGDPIMTLLGQEYSEESYLFYQAKLGLDKPFIVQLGNYIWNIITKFDFGLSITTGLPVANEIITKFPVTLKLGLLTVGATALLGIPFGIIASTKQYSILDYSVTSISVICAAIPGFVLALVLLMVFALNLRWLPMGGIKTWSSWILPVLSGSLPFVAVIARMTRTSMLEVVRQDYIRTARSKGLKEGYITRRHALPNALIPIVTSLGIQLGHIAGGALIIETIYAIPGMGLFMYSGISSRDYWIINGCVLVISIMVSGMNLIVDLAYAFIDPRVKAQYASRKNTNKYAVKDKKAKNAVSAEAQ